MPQLTLHWGAGRSCLLVKPVRSPGLPLEKALTAAGFKAVAVSSEGAALDALEREPFAAAFVSQRLGSAAIAAIIASSAGQQPEVPVFIVGATGTVQEAVEAIRLGAADYVLAPFETESLLAKLRKAVDRSQAREVAPATPMGPFPGIVGSSPAVRRVLTTIERISRYRANVLILGESGTGKELIARALHARGPRRQHLFVALNCATLGRDLLENELFGHERGAFTGATERKKGLFELADGGTLFLDEVVEMDPSTQAKLLRVLERNEFRRVGGAGKVKVDLSFIAATNKHLGDAVRAGKFREDLYYRLKVVTIEVPPLRERKEDIPTLVETFISDFNRRNEGKIRGIAPPALNQLMRYDWPGNIRELKNAVESAAILASDEILGPEAFAELAGARAPVPSSQHLTRHVTSQGSVANFAVGTSLARAEQALILATVQHFKTKREAAKVLGVGLRTLYTKLGQYRASKPR